MVANRQIVHRKNRKPSARIFILISIAAFCLTISYIWLYNEVDATLREIQSLTEREHELSQSVGELQAAIARLSRADRITRVARTDLDMVFPRPEAMTVTVQRLFPPSPPSQSNPTSR